MATQEQVDELIRLFAQARPQQQGAWQQRQRSATGNEGMLGVLLYLSRAEGTVTAGMVSKALHVTTGRVSALVKKMVEKGLVTRERGSDDARVTELKLTEKGHGVIEQLQKERNEQMKELIDTVGMDRLKDYAKVQKQVYSIIAPTSIEL